MSALVRILVAALLAAPILVFAQETVLVRIQTSEGRIEAVVDTVHAPLTAANFLRYVDHHFYDHGTFHRTVTPFNQQNAAVKIDVIQATIRSSQRDMAFPPIELEPTATTGLRHIAGSLSMARAGPNTATFDFFICVNDEPALDFGGQRNPDGQGFAAFGHVTKGMDVIRRIHASNAVGQKLAPPIKITSIERISPRS
jgi:peptidyl-prolyl cis-trans isomerase A (cyclophilin A)